MTLPIKFIFFGGEPLSVPVLEELTMADLRPSLVVCSPDRPVGRKQILTPPPTKIWAQNHGVEFFQPTSYKDLETQNFFKKSEWDLFVVVSYNFILPKWLIDLPRHKTINVHPSLLPKLRGASPIRTAIRDDLRQDIGITVMLLDEKMDHGPILNQVPVAIDDRKWPLPGPELDRILAHEGGVLLAKTITAWIKGEISPQEQDHEKATYCGKFSKSDSEVKIDPFKLPTGHEAKQIWLKLNAFSGIGDTFFTHKGKRVKIKQAELNQENSLQIQTVVPEGKKEMSFDRFLNNYGST